MHKILIANRGEIACRIIRTCKKLNISTLAIYSYPDEYAQHVKLADEAACLEGSESRDSYLRIDKIISVAKKYKVDAVHPGYGFLAENAEFALALEKEGITFIGPSPAVMKSLGDKIEAKAIADSSGIPTIPSLELELTDYKQKLTDFVKQHGFPLIVKAAAGGGGRGMRKVYKETELEEALDSAKREAEAAFGDGRLFIEKLVENARHVEVQFIGDAHGNAAHLFDRDCSFQRNHQKVIEEAPAPNVPDKVRKTIQQGSVNLAKKIGYCGVGTSEFLLSPNGEAFFLEVNSRLQVEHPVTELITGLDVVEMQIKVASGENLSSFKFPKKPKGAAIEARLCAEQPEKDFMVSTGTIRTFELKSTGTELRIDSGFTVGDSVTHHYDSLLAKVVASGSSRKEALESLEKALSSLLVCGVHTNISFLLKLLKTDAFVNISHHTSLAETFLSTGEEELKRKILLAGAISILSLNPNKKEAWSTLIGWRSLGVNPLEGEYIVNSEDLEFSIITNEAGGYQIQHKEIDKLSFNISAFSTKHFTLVHEDQELTCWYKETNLGDYWLATPWGQFQVTKVTQHSGAHHAHLDHGSNVIVSPLPGKVVSIKVNAGSQVDAGQTLLVIESMKMEHPLRATTDSVVERVLVKDGDTIDADAVLVELSDA